MRALKVSTDGTVEIVTLPDTGLLAISQALSAHVGPGVLGLESTPVATRGNVSLLAFSDEDGLDRVPSNPVATQMIGHRLPIPGNVVFCDVDPSSPTEVIDLSEASEQLLRGRLPGGDQSDR